MATWLRQSTAVDVALGPFVDSTDGFTPETALSLTQAECRLKKNANAWAQKNQATTAAHEEEGWYEVNLSATDTDTLGILILAVYVAGALPVWREFQIVPANVYDSFFATDLLQVDTREVGGTAQTAGDIIGDTNDIQARLPAALVAGRIDANVGAMAANVLTAAATAADFSTEVNAGVLAVLGALADAAADGDPTSTDTLVAYVKQLVNTLVGTTGIPTYPAAADPANGVSLAEAIRSIRDAVTNVQADTDNLQTRIPAALVGGRIDASVGAMATDVITAAALSDAAGDEIADQVWDEALAGHLGAGSTGEALNGAGAAGDPWSTALPGAYGAGSAGNILGTNLNATVSSRSSHSVADIWAHATRTLTQTIPTALENADALLARDLSAVAGAAARSPLNALRFLRNKWSIAGTTLTVTREDDTTPAWTATVATDPSVAPVTGSDPA